MMIPLAISYASIGGALVFYISSRGHSLPLRDIVLTGIFWPLHLLATFGLVVHTARIARDEHRANILENIKRNLMTAENRDVLLERIIDAQNKLR